MSDPERNECKDLQQHHLHICQLKKKGLNDLVAARTDNPGYICHNCNVVANRCEDLCNCSPVLKKD